MKCWAKPAGGPAPFSADGPVSGIRSVLNFLDDLEPRIRFHVTPGPARQLHGPAGKAQRHGDDWIGSREGH